MSETFALRSFERFFSTKYKTKKKNPINYINTLLTPLIFNFIMKMPELSSMRLSHVDMFDNGATFIGP